MPCFTFIYARKSHEEADRQVLSLDAQEKECRTYAQRHDLVIDEVIRESHSARRPGRPLFTELTQRAAVMLKRGQAVRILAHKPDRLLRNIGDWASINDLMDAGLELTFVTGSYENNAHGRLAFGVNVVFAKFYIDNLSEEVRKGIREKLARGEWPGWAPIGYRNVPDRERIVVDPAIAPLIVDAFESFATGEYSLQTLARRLGSRGLVGRRAGNPITKSVLHDHILTNPFYCGLIRHKGELHAGSHQPLVSVTLFERVQVLLRNRSRPRRRKHSFRLRGLLTCTRCGCAIVGDIKKGQYLYYRCSHRRGACPERYIRQHRLEELLRHRLAEVLRLSEDVKASLRVAAAEYVRDDPTLRVQATAATREAELRRRLATLLDLRLAGTITDEQYTEKQNQIAREQAKLREDQSMFELPRIDPREAVDWFISTCNSIADLLEQAVDEEARELLRIVGSNYQYATNVVNFEPVEPFTLAAQARNRAVWRATTDDIRSLVTAVEAIQSQKSYPTHGLPRLKQPSRAPDERTSGG